MNFWESEEGQKLLQDYIGKMSPARRALSASIDAVKTMSMSQLIEKIATSYDTMQFDLRNRAIRALYHMVGASVCFKYEHTTIEMVASRKQTTVMGKKVYFTFLCVEFRENGQYIIGRIGLTFDASKNPNLTD